MKKKITIGAFALCLIFGGCKNDENNEIVGTWIAPIALSDGYSYVTNTYTSDHTCVTCKLDISQKNKACGETFTYYLENNKIIISNGETRSFDIIKKDNKTYLRYYYDTPDDYYDFEKVD